MPRPTMTLSECSLEDARKVGAEEACKKKIRARGRVKTLKSLSRVRTQFDSGRKSK
jgi:hypothetical protein